MSATKKIVSKNEQERRVFKERRPDKIDTQPGRQIEGYRVSPERFDLLEYGIDYEMTAKSEFIQSGQSVQDFIVFANPSRGSRELKVVPPHWRTVNQDCDATVTLEKDVQNSSHPKVVHLYCANSKGVGYLMPTVRKTSLDEYETWITEDETGQSIGGKKVLGISTEADYMNGYIIPFSRWLASQGLRTELYWGVAKLKHLYFRGEKKSIREMQNKKVILRRKDFVPAIGVRLLRTNSRIEEASRATDRSRELFQEGFEVFNRETKDQGFEFPELRVGNPDLEKIYFTEFFRRIGSNISVLLNVGYSNYYLHSSNVTLAAEFVDLSTFQHWRNLPRNISTKHSGVREAPLKDMRDVSYDLRILLKAARAQGLTTDERGILQTAFFEGFNSVFDERRVSQQDTDSHFARAWMEAIFEKVIIKRENLPPLQHYEIEDWDIHV